MDTVAVVVIGAGPCGLGAATRLHQHGFQDWMLIDQASGAGGLACTDETPEGFLFDMGGHVIFSHYQYFDDLLDKAVGEAEEGWNCHQRVSYVWIRDRWVAYPFQNNIAALPHDDQVACLQGLTHAKIESSLAQEPPKSFDEWILRVMGSGIANIFMRPYNFKVWGVLPKEMQCTWLGERVATVNVDHAISNVVHGKEDAGWGPNATFRFPKKGGTGAIWKSVAELLPESKLRLGEENAVVRIKLGEKILELSDGREIKYKALLSTIPLDDTLRFFGKNEWANGLQFGSSHVVGLGIRGSCPHGSKCWLYFPESNCPFYRCTVFSNYAEANCPPIEQHLMTICKGDGSPCDSEDKSGPYWSLMFEVTESDQRPVNRSLVQIGNASWPGIVLEVMKGAIATKLISEEDEIVSLFHKRLQHGYPVPSLRRDDILKDAIPWLKDHGIWSRGRFGGYKYEVANQDHSLMQGVEAIDNILFGTMEATYNHPSVVNSAYNLEPKYTHLGCL